MLRRTSALLLLIVVSPVLLLATVTLFFTSKSGIFFLQERIGKNKKPFIIYKFTTMHLGEITKVGKYLRKTGIDELLQLINIIKGEMSFIGPRPLTSYDIKRLNWNTNDKRARWKTLPGITGMAQLSTVCSARDSIKNDLYYTKNKSIKLDTWIFLRSILIPIIGKPKFIPQDERTS